MAEPLPPKKILFVEDEAAIFEPFSKALRRNGFEPVIAQTAAEALELADRVDPDLVLLDLNLPDGDGARRLPRRSARAPTSRSSCSPRAGPRWTACSGLELGADDYVVKPFSSRELISRIRAVLRRATARRRRPPEGADRGRRAEARPAARDRSTLAGERVRR